MIYFFYIVCLIIFCLIVLAIFGDYLIEPLDELNDEDFGV